VFKTASKNLSVRPKTLSRAERTSIVKQVNLQLSIEHTELWIFVAKHIGFKKKRR
jgi:hypothetical protein